MGNYANATCIVCKKQLPANKMRPVGKRFVCSRRCKKSHEKSQEPSTEKREAPVKSSGASGGGVGKLLLLGLLWPYALMGAVLKSQHGLKIFGVLILIAGVGGFLEYQRDAAPPSDAEIQWALLNAEAIRAEEARLTKLHAEIIDHLANGEPELASIKIPALVWDPTLKNPYIGGKRDPHEKKWADINLKLRTTGVRSSEKLAVTAQDSQGKSPPTVAADQGQGQDGCLRAQGALLAAENESELQAAKSLVQQSCP